MSKLVFPKKFIQEQKEKLLNLRAQLLTQMNGTLKQEITGPQGETTEDGDQAQVYINQNLLISMQENSLRRLREIEVALQKIEEGTYGICEETGEPIEKKRLEKQPWARLCIQAAEDLEREQKRFYHAV